MAVASLIGRGALRVAAGGEPDGVVEQAAGEVVGTGLLAQSGDRAGERGARVLLAVAEGGEAGAGQVALGAQHGGELPGRVNPTTSQNSTEHTRRSATGPPVFPVVPAGAATVSG